MIGKSLLICASILTTTGIASAKSYDFTLSAPAKVGATELKPGKYTIKVEGSQAVLQQLPQWNRTAAAFTEDENGEPINVPVQVEQSDKKFGGTSVKIDNKDGTDHIREIDLNGSKTRLEFTQ